MNRLLLLALLLPVTIGAAYGDAIDDFVGEFRGRSISDGASGLSERDLSVSIEAKGEELFETLIRVASGEKTKSEELGFGGVEFVPWQIGAVM